MSAIDLGQDPPRVANTNKGEATIFNHREYLGDLYSGTGTPTSFTLQSYACNPGNKLLFPFLGPIAQRFQEYEIRGMIVELKTLSSDYAASLSMGSVFMAADYNVLGAAPASKQNLENMEYASSSKPSRSMIMPIECDPRNAAQTHLYIADDLDYEGGDKRLFDLCNIYIGTQGIPQATCPVAEIWLTYEVALFKPIINQTDTVQYDTISVHMNMQDIDDEACFGDGLITQNTGSSPGFGVTQTLSPTGACLFHFPENTAGTWLLIWRAVGNTSGVVDCQYPVTAPGPHTEVLYSWCSSSGQQTSDVAYGEEDSNTNEMQISMVARTIDPGTGVLWRGEIGFGNEGFTSPAAPCFGEILCTLIKSDMNMGL